MKAEILLSACLLCAGSVLSGSFEDISGNAGVKHDLRKNFHINFTGGTNESKLLYKRQLMEPATSPVSVPLKWYFSGIAPREYIVELATDKSFADAKKIVTDVNTVSVDNLLLSTVYYWRVSGMVNGKKVVSDVYTFQTADTPPRWIRVPGAGNFRDIGNWSVPGGRIKQGMIYRGCEMEFHHTITEDGKRVLLDDLKIKTDLDLRIEAVNAEMKTSALGEAVDFTLLPCTAYESFLKDKETAAKLFLLFTEEKRYPFYAHCWGGADRTGTLILLLMAILGVREDDLFSDYEFTSLSFWGKRSVRSNQFQTFLAELNTYGNAEDTINQRCEAFWRSCGITPAQLDTFRQIMTEP